MCIYLSIDNSRCIHLCLYYTKCEFVLMFLTVILYNTDHSNLPPYLSIIPHTNSEKSGSQYPPSIYLFVEFQYTFIGVSELLMFIIVGNKFTNWSTPVVQYIFAIHFAFVLLTSVHFQS